MSTRAITRTGTRGGSAGSSDCRSRTPMNTGTRYDGLYSLPEREQQFLRPEKIFMIAWDASLLWKTPHKPWNILAENVPFEMVKQCIYRANKKHCVTVLDCFPTMEGTGVLRAGYAGVQGNESGNVSVQAFLSWIKTKLTKIYLSSLAGILHMLNGTRLDGFMFYH